MRLAWSAAFTFALLALAGLGWGLFHPAASVRPAAAAVGGRAPDLVVDAVGGPTVRLADLRGRPVVVNFWASWCVYCRQEEAALRSAAGERGDRARFLGVDILDDPASAATYLRTAGFPYPVGPARGDARALYGVDQPPETIFIDTRGVIVARFGGPISKPQLDRYLQLAGAG